MIENLKYYFCVHGTPMKVPCLLGLRWNDRRRICDFPHNVACVERPTKHPGQKIPGTTPTEPPIQIKPLKPPKRKIPAILRTTPEPMKEPELLPPTPEPELLPPMPEAELEPPSVLPTSKPLLGEPDQPSDSIESDVDNNDNMKVICYCEYRL